jgi:hypothetical protein
MNTALACTTRRTGFATSSIRRERIERETLQNMTAGAPDRRRPMTALPIAVTGTLRYLDVMRR